MGAAAAAAVLGILDWIGFFSVPMTPPRNVAAVEEATVDPSPATTAEDVSTPIAEEKSPIVEPPAEATEVVQPRKPSSALPAESDSAAAQRRVEIVSHFTDDEVRQLNQILSRFPPEMAANLDKFIVTLPTEYVVQYIRSNILVGGRP
jgi:hypothetical protein